MFPFYCCQILWHAYICSHVFACGMLQSGLSQVINISSIHFTWGECSKIWALAEKKDTRSTSMVLESIVPNKEVLRFCAPVFGAVISPSLHLDMSLGTSHHHCYIDALHIQTKTKISKFYVHLTPDFEVLCFQHDSWPSSVDKRSANQNHYSILCGVNRPKHLAGSFETQMRDK